MLSTSAASPCISPSIISSGARSRTSASDFSVVQEIFGYRDGVHTAGAMNALLLPSGNTFIADTYVNDDPTPDELAEITSRRPSR